MAELRELPVRFGEGRRLLGILTLPAQHDATLPTVVIPNTGIEHRVGPNRLHVEMARSLAESGYAVLRFDIAGLGDSDAPRGAAPDATIDLQDAVHFLHTRQLGPKFLLIGLCSGAHDVHLFARNSHDVMAVLFIDGYAYPTARFQRRRLMQRLLRVHRKVADQVPDLNGEPGTYVPLASQSHAFFRKPSRTEATADFTAMLARGMHLAFLFTGDVEADYNYAEQHVDAFPVLAHRAEIWYEQKIDHTLTRRASREALVQRIHEWMNRIKAARPASAPAT